MFLGFCSPNSMRSMKSVILRSANGTRCGTLYGHVYKSCIGTFDIFVFLSVYFVSWWSIYRRLSGIWTIFYDIFFQPSIEAHVSCAKAYLRLCRRAHEYAEICCRNSKVARKVFQWLEKKTIVSRD